MADQCGAASRRPRRGRRGARGAPPRRRSSCCGGGRGATGTTGWWARRANPGARRHRPGRTVTDTTMTALLLALAVWSWGMAHRPPRRRPSLDAPHSPVARAPRRQRTVAADWARFLDTVAARVRGGSSLRVAFTDAQRDHPAQGHAIGVDIAPRRPASPRGRPTRTKPSRCRCCPPPPSSVAQQRPRCRPGRASCASVAAHATRLRHTARRHGSAPACSPLVPLVFAAWSFAASASFRRALATPPGMLAVLAGLVCNVLGWCWMRRIVRRALP